MLAICRLCATLSKEDLLIAISDKDHNVIHQLKHCFKFEIEVLPQPRKYVCTDCIKTLQMCDDFYQKIQRAQESLRILFKAKSQLYADKAAKKAVGTIRVRDFCKMQNWDNKNESESTKEPAAKTVKTNEVSENSKTDFSVIEEYTCSSAINEDITEIKVESEDTNDPLATNSNADSNEQTGDQSMVFEDFLLKVLRGKSDVVEENITSPELSTSDEANFAGFEQTLEDENYMEEHLEEDTEDEDLNDQIRVSIVKYQCETCSKDFPNEEMLQKHLNCHSNERAFKCKLCPKVFHHQSSLYYHSRSHLYTNSDEGEYKCNYCDKTYHRLNSLKIHLRTHSTENTFQCKICLKDFRHASSLWYHMKAHANDRQYQCHYCSKAYYRRINLENHLIAHQKRRLFTCEICEESFFGQQKLTKHIDEQHTGRDWKCTKCPDAFSTITDLNNHLRLHTESQYTCAYCHKGFRSAIWYESHLRTHNVGVRTQFECANCTVTFPNRQSLTEHTCEKAAEN